MSRIGKKPVAIPAGVEASLEGNIVTVKKGNKSTQVDTKGFVEVEIKDNQIIVSPLGQTRENRAFWGTFRALIANAIEGLEKGFKKSLEINGVGYRAAVKGNTLELLLGFSHPINFAIPEDITITVEKNIINIEGTSKQLVGQVAADIRGYRPPEPYKGKGVKYVDEHIIRKAGKTAKK